MEGARRNILSLPMELLLLILLKVCGKSSKNLFRVRSCCKTFKNLTEEPYFCKTIDLYAMKLTALDHNVVFAYKRLCLKHGNPSAMLLKGACDFLIYGKSDEGLSLMREAAYRGHDVAMYMYGNIARIMNLDDHNLIADREEYVRLKKIFRTSQAWGFTSKLPNDHPLSIRESDMTPMFYCECNATKVWMCGETEDYLTKEVCDSCFWIIQNMNFAYEWPIRVPKWV